jgi:hypothetical protein
MRKKCLVCILSPTFPLLQGGGRGRVSLARTPPFTPSCSSPSSRGGIHKQNCEIVKALLKKLTDKRMKIIFNLIAVIYL